MSKSTKKAAPQKSVTVKVVAGRKTRLITAPPDLINAAVDKAIAEMDV